MEDKIDGIVPVSIIGEMEKSYLDYAMSVIVSRAIPNVCDGLKPVHRRILYCMKESGYDYNKPFKKSARIVGEVIGKYHPHGDQAVYGALVRMAQDFAMRMTLINGQGNFGSVDGDSPAAMRYTEARLNKFSYKLLEDLDFNTVNFIPNYDESLQEPIILPSKYPNLLVNGSGGIAVGMATNIPTHNLSEVIDACCYYIKNGSINLDEVLELMPGPDFSTGGIIVGKKGIHQYFSTGRGIITIRGCASIEETNTKSSIVIREIPYQVNKAKLVERIAELAREKVIENITAVRDESDKEGLRVVVELKRDASGDVILNQLYKETQLQVTFGVNILALNNGRPDIFNIPQIIKTFINFRRDIVVKRTKYELGIARDKVHLLTGLILAVINIDKVISIIKASKDTKEAKESLLSIYWDAAEVQEYIELVKVQEIVDGKFKFSEKQVQAILDLKLNRLTGLERNKLSEEISGLAKDIAEYLSILNSEKRILEVIEKELLDIKEEFGVPRKTQIIENPGDFDEEDFIESEDNVITVTSSGYIKRVPADSYKSQKRGGKGRSGMATKDGDFVKNVFFANTHDTVLFFTSKGIAFQSKVYKLPLGSMTSKGKSIVNFLSVEKDETISTILTLPSNMNDESIGEKNIIFSTSLGSIRRNKLKDFMKIQSNGKRAIKLDNGEKLVSVAICDDESDIILATYLGKCVRFHVSELRVFASHNSSGVRGIKLIGDDTVISMDIVQSNPFTAEERDEYIKYSNVNRKLERSNQKNISNILNNEKIERMAKNEEFFITITEKGYGKRTSSYEYRTTSRGGLGVKNIEISEKNGNVISVFKVNDVTQDIVITTNQGQMIRFPVSDIRITGRATQGVIIFRISEGEVITSAVPVMSCDDSEELETE